MNLIFGKPAAAKAMSGSLRSNDLRLTVQPLSGLPAEAHKSEGWCGREDLNFHGFYPTTTSTLRVYQFRHDRIFFTKRNVIIFPPKSPNGGLGRVYQFRHNRINLELRIVKRLNPSQILTS